MTWKILFEIRDTDFKKNSPPGWVGLFLQRVFSEVSHSEPVASPASQLPESRFNEFLLLKEQQIKTPFE